MSDPVDGRTARAQRQRSERRAQILDAAQQLFALKGYHDTSIADVVSKANVARGTFYQYFDGKHAIFVELLERLLQDLRAQIRGVDQSPQAAPVTEQLHRIVVRLLDAVARNRATTMIIFRQTVGVDPDVDKIMADFYGNLGSFVELALSVGQSRGLVRDLDIPITAACILGSVRYVVESYVTSAASPPENVEHMASVILDFNLRGVLQS